MDRRKQKTRAAIFGAVGRLLASKSYGRITVQEIIDEANVGRTTFYAHFETKDDLLRELCEELFGHIVASAADRAHTHGLRSDGEAAPSTVCHLLQHLKENDLGVVELLSCEDNGVFLRYFKRSLGDLMALQFVGGRQGGGVASTGAGTSPPALPEPVTPSSSTPPSSTTPPTPSPELATPPTLPSSPTPPTPSRDFLVNHVTGSFVEMVMWWIDGGMRLSPEDLDRWFRAVIEPAVRAWRGLPDA